MPAGNFSKIGGAFALWLHSSSSPRESGGIKVIETIYFINIYLFISNIFEYFLYE